MAPRNSLLNMSEERFAVVVNNDLKPGKLDEKRKQELRSPEVVTRWYRTLLTLKRSVESQFAAGKAERSVKISEYMNAEVLPIVVTPPREDGTPAVIVDMTEPEFLAWHAKWRAGAIRFLSGVEDRLGEAKEIRSGVLSHNYASLLVKERDNYLNDTLRLRHAILTHRDSVSDDEDKTAAADEELWALVD